jgi:hypothetical protein
VGLAVSLAPTISHSAIIPKENPMNFGDFIPISLFICIAYSIKVCVDAMVRRHMVNAGGSEELVNSVLRDEQQRRRHSSLRWGIVLLSVGLGFGLIQWFGWQEITPGLIAVLAGATGLGNLAFFAISRRIG